MTWDIFVALLAATVLAGTPLLYATMGELITERSGVLNLGVEGMMIMGAFFAFIVQFKTGNPWLAALAAGVGAGCLGLIHGVVCLIFQGNQTVSGLALTIFGVESDKASVLGLARFFLISALSARCAGCFFAYCHVPTHAIALVCSEAFAGHFKSAYQHRPQDGVAKRRSNRNINFFQARGFCPERVARPRCDQSWHQFALHVDAFGRPQFRCADSCDRCSGQPSSSLLGGLPL